MQPVIFMKPTTEPEAQVIVGGCCVALKLPQSIATDSDNMRFPNGVLVTWGYRKSLWPQRSVLRVRFMGGDSKQRSLMWDRFKKVDAMCGLSFKLVESGPSDCRVGFLQNYGHWSYVGTDNAKIPQIQQTMNIALTSRDSGVEWDRVAIHEIFHLIGLNHEHQHPKGVIPWNRPMVYKVYGQTQGWSKQEIDYQVLNPSSPDGMIGTATPDKDSIMMYPIERRLLLPGKENDKYAVGWNTKPSKGDLLVVSEFYPN